MKNIEFGKQYQEDAKILSALIMYSNSSLKDLALFISPLIDKLDGLKLVVNIILATYIDLDLPDTQKLTHNDLISLINYIMDYYEIPRDTKYSLPKNISMTTGEFIRFFRGYNQMSIERLSELTGIKPSILSCIEIDQKIHSLDTKELKSILCKLGEVLKIKDPRYTILYSDIPFNFIDSSAGRTAQILQKINVVSSKSVIHGWITELSLKQQTVLLSAIRGCDISEKNDISKLFIRKLRSVVLIDASPNGGDFMKSEIDDKIIYEFIKSMDKYPFHFIIHFTHAAEIIGYKHPSPSICKWWRDLYEEIVHGFNMNIETEEECDKRLLDGIPIICHKT
jgi:hypothetical protein